MIKYILTGLLTLLISLAALAQDGDEKQRLYVTDKLRLSLYLESGGRGGTIELLASGETLIIEEVNGSYALVTSPSGKLGWVKRGFLVLEPTSNLMLEEEKKITKSLEREIEKLKNSKVIIDQYEKDLNAMNDKLQISISARGKAESTIQMLEQAVEESMKKIEVLSESDARPSEELLRALAATYWKYLAAIGIFIVLTGFFIGKLMAEAKVKKKFHGIKVW